jgi:hypothetical protein
MKKGEFIEKDAAGIEYDPADYINEFIIPTIEDGIIVKYDVYCPTCRKLMYISNEPCRLLSLTDCLICNKV